MERVHIERSETNHRSATVSALSADSLVNATLFQLATDYLTFPTPRNTIYGFNHLLDFVVLLQDLSESSALLQLDPYYSRSDWPHKMSSRQDIDLNDWHLFEKSSMHPYIPSLRNDIDHARHPDHAPESIVRPEQFTPPSFDQVPGTDRTNTSSALGTHPHEQRTPDDLENMTWPWEFNLPRPMNSPPGHPAPRILPKHGCTQGAKTNTRRRQKKQVK